MRVLNYDAHESLVEKIHNGEILLFALNVIRQLEEDQTNFLLSPYQEGHFGENHQFMVTPIRKLSFPLPSNIAHHFHTIPIYLRDKRPEYTEGEGNIIDLLGAYFPNRHADNPYIELYLSNIENDAKGNDLHFKWIFTMVLLHELAHATHDVFNFDIDNPVDLIPYHTTYGRWREESMANATALHFIHRYGDKDFYEFTKDYMKTQSTEYALGVIMEERFDPMSFRLYFFEKIGGVDPEEQQAWLQMAKTNPTPGELFRRDFPLIFPK